MNKFENYSEPSPENSANEQKIHEIASTNFSQWNSALQTGDAKKVASLYSPESTFLPTVSDKFIRGQEEAEGYFEHFLEKNPTGEIIDETVRVISPDSYLHSGMYNFEVGQEDKRETLEARFSFIWKKDEAGQWQIIHHHSSVKPK